MEWHEDSENKELDWLHQERNKWKLYVEKGKIFNIVAPKEEDEEENKKKKTKKNCG